MSLLPREKRRLFYFATIVWERTTGSMDQDTTALGAKRSRADRFEEDALREVLAVERQAQGIIRDAEAEALRITARATKRAQELKAEAEAAMQGWAAEALSRSDGEIEQDTRTIMEKADLAAREWVEEAQRHIDEALAYILGVVTLGETH